MLIVGLGNPGDRYQNTRHNVGFMALDRVADHLSIPVNTIKFKGLYGEGRILGKKVRLLKPMTYMNESGQSVRECMQYFKIAPEEVLVLVDDIDIEFGTVRLRKSGSAGTHNGLKSIIYQIQSDQFPRLKIAVGKKNPHMDLADFVLSGFSKEEIPVMDETLEKAKGATLSFLKEGIDSAMNSWNGK
ncbi:aminoacyl-tRNA hydrolase [Aedoeadaptatus coxii]|uniref:Peptidyl-tRNA hydrolase n=1 Tax=Aedoeadaptatus coxii TaxID=755172 RepID=A0A134AHB0_9FIRM|nr:aminoacyl-tRNA hydrolase [Peptoniphilus coxii]KXB67045.1 aminoacyl-tRNA hydrolase [Peptoniphilus coxii]CAC9928921.1 aminoacyl-tRNA hydrolase [Peptoniphilus coxii]